MVEARRRTRSSDSATDAEDSGRADRTRARAVSRGSVGGAARAGFRNQYADGFKVLHPEQKLAGRAFTVQFMPLRPDLEASSTPGPRRRASRG